MEGELVANIQRRSSLDYGAENARFELCRAHSVFLLYLWFKQSPPGKEGKQVTLQQAPRTRARSLATRYKTVLASSATAAQQVS